jgi:hypothetical protein
MCSSNLENTSVNRYLSVLSINNVFFSFTFDTQNTIYNGCTVYLYLYLICSLVSFPLLWSEYTPCLPHCLHPHIYKCNTECISYIFSLLTQKHCFWLVIIYYQPFIPHCNFIWCQLWNTWRYKERSRNSGNRNWITFWIENGDPVGWKCHVLDLINSPKNHRLMV